MTNKAPQSVKVSHTLNTLVQFTEAEPAAVYSTNSLGPSKLII